MLEDNRMIFFSPEEVYLWIMDSYLKWLNLKCLDDLFLAYSPITVFLLTKGMDWSHVD